MGRRGGGGNFVSRDKRRYTCQLVHPACVPQHTKQLRSTSQPTLLLTTDLQSLVQDARAMQVAHVATSDPRVRAIAFCKVNPDAHVRQLSLHVLNLAEAAAEVSVKLPARGGVGGWGDTCRVVVWSPNQLGEVGR